MKKAMLFIAILIAVLGCNYRTSSPQQTGDSRDLPAEEEKEPHEAQDKIIPEETIPEQQGEYKTAYFGTFYITAVDSGPLNVRKYPSLDAEIVAKLETDKSIVVTGISNEKDQIEGHSGHWFRIRTSENKDAVLTELGWVFSKYVKTLSDLEPDRAEFSRYTPATSGYGDLLEISIGGQIMKVLPHTLENQEFYTFTWAEGEQTFNYRHIPGTYVWYPDTNEIRHITYRGYSLESAWVVFTDDFRYMIQDFGTSPGVRAIGVYDVASGNSVFSGGYLNDINLEETKIEIAFVYNERNLSQGLIDSETENHAKRYLEEKTLGKYEELVVLYKYDFTTKQRDYIGCSLSVVQ